MAEELACGHDKSPFGVPLCMHLRSCREPWLQYVKWFVGTGLETEYICIPCAEARERGVAVEAHWVCQQCYEYATEEVGDLVRAGGKPEVRARNESSDQVTNRTPLPSHCGRIIDIAPVNRECQSIWLLLEENGRVWRFDAYNGDAERLAIAKLPSDVSPGSFLGHTVSKRIHASDNGAFAAVVNDYGQYGQVLDLRSGKITLKLDGGDYQSRTVPFSFAFAERHDRVVAIHRTAWNRLDASDAETGKLLTSRPSTSYKEKEERPQHYLDYFHGALYISPSGTHILDDGWVWHPVGIPVTWSLQRWLSENAWESEDGPSRKEICGRTYYWDHGMVWLNEETVVIGGIGDDSSDIVDGARVFDIISTGPPGPQWSSKWLWARQITAFAGPTGKFFSDGVNLYSAANDCLSKWDARTGERTGLVEGFCPSHHHIGAGELAQLKGGALVRWSLT